ncbi:MAG TPA: hypothetical protein VFW47_04615 [Phenylobacterium sp.]|nr:hypothetical protein [Phenylobacterium sp.]
MEQAEHFFGAIRCNLQQPGPRRPDSRIGMKEVFPGFNEGRRPLAHDANCRSSDE